MIEQDISLPNNVSVKRCVTCNRLLPGTVDYFVLDRGRIRNKCKKCRNQQESERKQQNRNGSIHVVASISPGPTIGTPDQCAVCDTRSGNIIAELDEVTREIRGYLCTKCYRVLINFNDDPVRIRKVADYIESTGMHRL